MTPDVNVLLAAARADHPHHQTARAWLENALDACQTGASLKLMPLVVASFLRLITHPKIFVQPASMPDALAFIDALLAEPGVEMPALGEEWPILRQLCLEQKLKANDVPDAWLAAAAVRYGEHVVTFDVDFKRLMKRSHVTILTAAQG